MATDTMDPQCEGMHGFSKCQVYGNKQMFAAAYPAESGSGQHIDETLKSFIQDFGAPDLMIVDGAKSQTQKGSAFVSRLQRNRIELVTSPPYRPNYNPCETVIRELQK